MFDDLKNKIGQILSAPFQPTNNNPLQNFSFQNVAGRVGGILQPIAQQFSHLPTPQVQPVFNSPQIDVASFIGSSLHDLSQKFNLPAPVQMPQNQTVQDRISTTLSGLQPHVNFLQTQQNIQNMLHQIDPTTTDPNAFINNAPVLGGVRQTFQKLDNGEAEAYAKSTRYTRDQNGKLVRPQLTPEEQQKANNYLLGMIPFGGMETVGRKVAQEALTEGGNLLRKTGVGQFTNVKAIDNPLVSGAIQKGEQTINDFVGSLKATRDPQNITQPFEDMVRSASTPVKDKINLLDYFRTPQFVLEKIGLGNESKLLRQNYNNYLDELPKEIDKITNWSNQVGEGASQRIFQYLDGKLPTLNNPVELRVAGEMKSYLAGWADRLGLPADRRITSYITHIWEKDTLGKEFPDEIANIIRDKVAGSVYDPFVQQRLGQQGYQEDVFKALDAYTKRAVRKVNMDEALFKIQQVSQNLENSQFNYVKRYIDKINLRPTEIDTLIDNLIKSSPIGYSLTARPTAYLTRTARQWVYRGLLGLNPHSAIQNLTQGLNTYAILGEKYTLLGYAKVAQNLPKILSGAETELDTAGVLRQAFIQDRTLTATKQFIEKLDKGLFYLFDRAEVVNRGASYWGAKAKGLSEGMNEQQAINYAKDIVRKTQFTFGQVDSPVALQSDLAKTFAQFQNYSIKQGEFLGGLIKNRDIAGLVRFTGASLVTLLTIGKLWGMRPRDLIPSLRFGVPPTLQLPYGVGEAITQNKNQYGQSLTPTQRIFNKDVVRGALNYVPAGNQIRRTIEGLQALQEGGVYSPSGKLKYPSTSIGSVLFGNTSTQEAQDYYNKNIAPLGDKQTQLYKDLLNSGMSPQDAYKTLIDQRNKGKEFKDLLNQNKPNNPNVLEQFFNNEQQKPSSIPSSTTTTGDPLLDLYTQEKKQTERTNKVKQILDLGLPPAETDRILQKAGLGTLQEAQLTILKSLTVESRANYLQQKFKGLSSEDFLRLAQTYSDNKVLTAGVTAEWLDKGIINQGQKRMIDNIIAQSKGKTLKSKILIRPRLKKTGKFNSRKIRVKTMIPKIKPLKPINTNLSRSGTMQLSGGGF